MARRRGNFTSRAPRRLTDWQLGFITNAYVTVPANSKVLLASITAAMLATVAPATIIRTRGIVSVTSDQAAAVEEQLGGIGLTFVSELARAAGVASIPGPVSDFGWEGWFVHQFFAQKQQLGANANMSQVYEIDSRAMRKFDDDSGLALVAENIDTTEGLDIAVFLRILVKAG